MAILVEVNKNRIHLHGVIELASSDNGSFTALDVIQALQQVGDTPDVYINSPGGDAGTGLSIYETLKERGVNTFVDGIAASAASLVFLAGTRRTMASNASLMIHRAHVARYGNSSELRKIIAALDQIDAQMVDIYSEYMSASKAEISAMLDAETWFDAKTGKEAGLATAIDLSKSKRVQPLAAWFKNPPVALLAQHQINSAQAWAARSRLLELEHKALVAGTRFTQG